MNNTLSAAQHSIDPEISATGDGWLPWYKDPFIFDVTPGVFVDVRSDPGHQLSLGGGGGGDKRLVAISATGWEGSRSVV